MRAFNNANGIHVRRNPGVAGDFEIGDIITTQTQEDSFYAIGSDLFNSVPTALFNTDNFAQADINWLQKRNGFIIFYGQFMSG